MKKPNYKYILIFSVFVLVITIFFIINNNIKIESLDYSQYIDASDERMIKYDNLYGGPCYVECTQQTIPNKCNYALMSGDIHTPGSCTLYNTINNAKYSPTNQLHYMSDIKIPSLNYDNNIDKGYYSDVNLIKTIDNVHKLTCDYECAFNHECTSYTSTIDNDPNKVGTCKFYSGSNNITDQPGSNIYTKNPNNFR